MSDQRIKGTGEGDAVVAEAGTCGMRAHVAGHVVAGHVVAGHVLAGPRRVVLPRLGVTSSQTRSI